MHAVFLGMMLNIKNCELGYCFDNFPFVHFHAMMIELVINTRWHQSMYANCTVVISGSN